MKESEPFSYLKFSNIPLENLLEEFLIFKKVLTDDTFRKSLKNAGRESINAVLLEWNGSIEDLLTLMVQRSILGLEAYICGAVWIEAGKRGLLTSELNKKIRNPFVIKGRGGAAEKFYNKLPHLLEPNLGLKENDEVLWNKIESFYELVRNPMFHGQQLETNDPEDVLPCMSTIHFTYEWINSWHELEVTKLRPRHIVFDTNN